MLRAPLLLALAPGPASAASTVMAPVLTPPVAGQIADDAGSSGYVVGWSPVLR